MWQATMCSVSNSRTTVVPRVCPAPAQLHLSVDFAYVIISLASIFCIGFENASIIMQLQQVIGGGLYCSSCLHMPLHSKGLYKASGIFLKTGGGEGEAIPCYYVHHFFIWKFRKKLYQQLNVLRTI